MDELELPAKWANPVLWDVNEIAQLPAAIVIKEEAILIVPYVVQYKPVSGFVWVVELN